jgi:glycosyltransferase involved in cell wall biosynthesis
MRTAIAAAADDPHPFLSQLDTSRPVLIVGNGPSAGQPDYSRIPANAYVFRMNHFYFEPASLYGRRADFVLWSVRNQLLHEKLQKITVERGYDIGCFCFPSGILQKDDANGILTQTFQPYLDHWSVISRRPELGRRMMSRPLPTQGVQAVAMALILGFREIFVIGMDFYQPARQRYYFQPPATDAARLKEKDLALGYEKNHSLETDIAFLRATQACFPEARIASVSAKSYAATLLGLAEPQAVPFPSHELPADEPDADEPVAKSPVTPPPAAAPANGTKTTAILLIDNFESRTYGMNRGIMLNLQPLKDLGLDLRVRYALCPSHNNRISSLIRMVTAYPWKSADLVLINSLSCIVQGNSSMIRLLRRIAHWHGKPVVFYWHESTWIFNRIARKTPDKLHLLRELCADTNVWHLACSDYARGCVESFFKPHNRVQVAHPGNLKLPETIFPISFGSPLVVNIASIQDRKGPDLFLETARQVLKSRPDTTFVWIGTGREKLMKFYLQKAAAPEFAGRVYFLDHVEQPWNIAGSSSVFFCSSRDEPFGLGVTEAMGLGIPVVAFESGGPQELVAGHGGVIVPDFDTELAADAIIRVLDGKEGDGARLRTRYLERFSPEQCMLGLIAELETVRKNARA